MTTAQRDAISLPDTGLQIYNTDNRAIETFTGTTGEWFTLGRGKGAVVSNTAVGVQALYSNTSGYRNTANGYAALYDNTTGNYNTANGYYALVNNTTGSSNTAAGYGALQNNTTGSSNTAAGYGALQNNTTAANNTANGYGALQNNTTGTYNTANGSHALLNNTSSYNTANGYAALYNNTAGYGNTANGYQALKSNITGRDNTANGHQSLLSNTSGHSNTANGYKALHFNTTGYWNTAIGYHANVSLNNLFNATAIGLGAMVTASNRVRIGNGSVARIGGQVGWSTLSDGRIKENVQEAVPGLSFIAELRPVTYTLNTRKQDAINMQAMPDSIQDERMLSDDEYLASSSIVRTGFIAQEVEAAAQKVGFDFDGVCTPQNETDLYSIRYAEFVVPLVKAMQEQQAMIAEQQKTIDGLLERIEALEN
jgi:hypothetical protein